MPCYKTFENPYLYDFSAACKVVPFQNLTLITGC